MSRIANKALNLNVNANSGYIINPAISQLQLDIYLLNY